MGFEFPCEKCFCQRRAVGGQLFAESQRHHGLKTFCAGHGHPGQTQERFQGTRGWWAVEAVGRREAAEWVEGSRAYRAMGVGVV